MSCPAGSYCKDYMCPAVCQGYDNITCSIPGQKYSCSGSSCVQDANGLYNSCCDANCSNSLFCCNPNVGCKQVNGASCPSGSTSVTSCDQCKINKTVFCCDPTGVIACGPYTNSCPQNMSPVSSCDECKKPVVYVNCCNTSGPTPTCKQYPDNCPPGTNVVSTCSICPPPQPVVVQCCDSNYNCGPQNNSCPTGSTQVADCSTCLRPIPPPDPVFSCCKQGHCLQAPLACPTGYDQVYSCDQCTQSIEIVNCCNPATGCCVQSENSCPSGFNQVTDCSLCSRQNVTVQCCDASYNCNPFQNYCPAGSTQVSDCSKCTLNCCDSSYNCNSFTNTKTCPSGSTQVSDCSKCKKPTVTLNCCDSSYNCNTYTDLTTCPQGSTQVSDCSKCKKPTVTLNCCDSSYNCDTYTDLTTCPQGSTQVSDCSKCKKPTPSGTCPNVACAQGGLPLTFWAEHPPVGADVTEPKVIQYYQLMNNFICQPNPAGMCVSTLVLRLETPVEQDGTRNCFYPSTSSPLYSELLVNLPTDFQIYAMPYFDSSTSWAAYPDTQADVTELGTLATYACSATCNIPQCTEDCTSGYQCVNGSCYTSSDQCGGCLPGQTCMLGYLKKYPVCLNICSGKCCAGTVDASGAGNCCDGTACDNALARSVLLVKKWNELLGRNLFKGLVVDSEGSGYSRAVIATKIREANRALGVNFLVGTTYDGSNVGRCVADLTATDDTRMDLAFPEVYNLTTQCNTGKDPWAPGSQLVDSYDKAPTIGGCNALPYPSTNSLYAQAWQTPNPAQTLWSGNGALNFQNIIRYGWSKQVTQDVANRIYPLLSVETSAISPVQTCMYPAGGSGGPCGIPNAFGVWNTVQGAKQLTQFIQLFQSSLSDIFLAGSGTIPVQNFGIFSFPIMPKAWFA